MLILCVQIDCMRCIISRVRITVAIYAESRASGTLTKRVKKGNFLSYDSLR